MINIITGLPGSGKTFYLTKIAYENCLNKINVYANFNIDFSNIDPELNKYLFFWNDLNNFHEIKQGVILIDECQIYFNSRAWKNLPLRVQYKFQQHRKQGITIFGAVQNINRIDKIIREIVNWVFVVKRLGSLFIINKFDIFEIDKVKRRTYETKFFLMNKKIANCYDTFEEIAPFKN